MASESRLDDSTQKKFELQEQGRAEEQDEYDDDGIEETRFTNGQDDTEGSERLGTQVASSSQEGTSRDVERGLAAAEHGEQVNQFGETSWIDDDLAYTQTGVGAIRELGGTAY